MAFRGIPFDSKMVSDSSGTYEDRQVFSEDFARYLGFVSSDGICLKDDEELTSQLLVEAGTGSEVILNPGTVKIQGRMGWITEPESLFANPGGSLPRIDSAVIELNLSTSVRGFVFKIVEGEESSNPEPPILVRTPDVWQLGLGNFYRTANSTSLGEFTDTRLDSERCGVSKVATPNIGADTLTLWQQSYPDITNLNDILHLIGSEGLPEEFGGTHSKSLPEARQNINFIGLNPIASVGDDTPANWAALGTGTAQYNTNGLITDQPSTYATVENIVVGDGNVIQIWHKQGTAPNPVYYRVGYPVGWRHSWVKMLDETNGIQIKKLWENASPTSAFDNQTINIPDIANYDLLLIMHRTATHHTFDFVNVDEFGGITNSQLKTNAYINGKAYGFRNINVTSTGVVMQTGYYSNSDIASKDLCKPMKIFGVKGVQ